MQKHQWRQHAIVHFKTRPANTSSSAPLGIIGAEGVLFNTLMERVKDSGNGGLGQYEDSPPLVSDLSEHTPLPLSEVPEPSAHTEIDNFSDDGSLSSHSITNAVTKYLNGNDDPEEPEDNPIDNPGETMAQLQLMKTDLLVQPKEEVADQKKTDDLVQKPMKLKMKFAQAYMREVKEEREREERDSREREGRDSYSYEPIGDDSSSGIGAHLSEIQLSTGLEGSQLGSVREDVVVKEESGEGGSVECVCKSCGSKCLVSDPYNFRCSGCHVKYTSLPTHLIADPLQCIGCLEVFAHKPAMKAHQSSAHQERPFRCCRCGYQFRQKAHLQKHQWRIHRRKLEPDPSVKEAEALLQVVNETPPLPEARLTIQQIIETSVERGLREEGAKPSAKPLDLSPTKLCLDLPHSKMTSITAWLQQVETARTPIKPDISILKKPLDLTESQDPASGQQSTTFLTMLSPGPPRTEESGLTIKLLEPKGIVWPREPLPQQFAVKSKPMTAIRSSLSPTWRRPEREDNPLLNQRPEVQSSVSLEVAPPTPSPTSPPQASYKRARTEGDYAMGLPPPFPSYPTDLSKPHPLDLSSDYRPHRSEAELASPFDYSINRSELISGQLTRLKNLDNRSGI